MSTESYPVLRQILADHVPEGWAIEFGVWSGASLALIADYMPVIGLDSFQGLPEDWREGFPKGSFARDPDNLWGDKIPKIPLNAMLVEGWFEDTIPVLRAWGLPRIGLIHVDCDLYSSTKTVLDGMRDHITPGCIVVFDEFHGYEGWENHEAKAWGEFVDEHRVIYRTLATGAEERAFQITSIGV